MRTKLLCASLVAACAAADEPSPPPLRERLRERIVASLPPTPASTATAAAADEPIVVLEPLVIEDKAVRDLTRLLASERARLEADRFTPLRGGTISRSERVEVGGWYLPNSGWQFLRFKW